MLLTVDHVTRYRYDQPVRGVVQSHRLTPSVYDGQRVVDWSVTVTDGRGAAFSATGRATGSGLDGAGPGVRRSW
jgi:hypothetical protein